MDPSIEKYTLGSLNFFKIHFQGGKDRKTRFFDFSYHRPHFILFFQVQQRFEKLSNRLTKLQELFWKFLKFAFLCKKMYIKVVISGLRPQMITYFHDNHSVSTKL